MSYDLAHCRGAGCPLRDQCRRTEYFRKSGGIAKYENHISVIEEPFAFSNGKFACSLFLGSETAIMKYNLKKR